MLCTKYENSNIPSKKTIGYGMKICGMNITSATSTAPIATVSIIPAATSFAIFALSLYSVVIRSVMDSIDVLIISAVNPRIMVNMMIANSTRVI